MIHPRLVGVLVCLLSVATPAAADWSTATVPVGADPSALAVNPFSNQTYVANSLDNSLTVIDGLTNVTSTVTVGAGPCAVAVNPATDVVYVANSLGGSVTAVNGATHQTETIAVGSGPCALAVNPVTDMIYVTNSLGGSVTVIDGANNSTENVTTGTGPTAVAVNPVTNLIYVADSYDNTVTVIDGATNSIETVAVGTGPCAIAVNPVTNTIFVANSFSNDVTVIDGANNSTQTVTVGAGPGAIAVNPVVNQAYVANENDNSVTAIDGATLATDEIAVGTGPCAISANAISGKVYVANFGSGSVTVIDGTTHSAATVATGNNPYAVAPNPVTGKVYAMNRGGGSVTVIDGATNSLATVAARDYPCAVAVNPVTDKVYVTNHSSGNVTVIDGATNETVTIGLADGPCAVAINPVTNRIYVTNIFGDNVAVINGETNTAVTVPTGFGPHALAVNISTNKVYVANYWGHSVTVIDGATNDTTTVPAGDRPMAVAVNAVTNRIYVASRNSNDVTVIDGVTNETVTVPAGSHPEGIAVNPVSNKIYVANSLGSDITVIDGATNDTMALSSGIGPKAIAVNTATNRIYVANDNSDEITVIDGATDSTMTVTVGDHPRALAINPVTNKIYVANYWSDNITVIDGATHATLTIPVDEEPRAVAVNPVTGKVYVTNQASDNVTVIDDVAVHDTRVRAAVLPFADNATCHARPGVTGRGVNRFHPHRTPLMGILVRPAGAAQTWRWAEVTSGAGTDSVDWNWTWGSDSLVMGENLLVVQPLESDAGITGNHGLGVPFAGNPLVYPLYRIDGSEDVGVTRIMAPLPAVDSGVPVAPRCSVCNYGTLAETYNVRMTIGAFYDETVLVGHHPPGSTRCVAFPAHSAWPRGRHAIACSSALSMDMLPANDKLTDTLAVRVSDVGCTAIIAPTGVVESGTAITPACSVYNYGSTVRSYTARMRIGGTYTRTTAIVNHLPGTCRYATFPEWTAGETGTHAVSCSTEMYCDAAHANDALVDSVTVRYLDAGVVAITRPVGVIDSAHPVTPQVRVKNFGSEQAGFLVWFRVHTLAPAAAAHLPRAARSTGRTAGPAAGIHGHAPSLLSTQVYEDSAWVTIGPGDSTLCDFAPWLPLTPGEYQLESFTSLPGDRNPANDTAGGTVTVVTLLRDVGIAAVLAPVGHIDSGTVVIPQAVVENFGTLPEEFLVRFTIGQAYRDTMTLLLGPRTTDTVSFASWNADEIGSYPTCCATLLPGDMNPWNDTIEGTVEVNQVIRDVGVSRILVPVGTVDSGTAITPAAVIVNFGTTDEEFQVEFSIGGFYYNLQDMTLPAGQTDTVVFSAWTASPVGRHVTRCATLLFGDMNPPNDMITDTVRVVPAGGIAEQVNVPADFSLGQPGPNPFRDRVAIRYGLPRPARVELAVYSTNGRLVRRLRSGTQEAGFHRATWDGRDESGRPAVSGIYYCRMTAGQFIRTRKLVKSE